MSTQQDIQQKEWRKHDWLEYLESTHPADIEMGLGRVTQVAQTLNLFKPAKITIVVGGTNGKGTTTALLGQLLAQKGLTSGCYNSPHIHQYNERVNRRDSVSDSRMTTDDELCQAFLAIEQGRGDIPLTYFEFGTLAALWQIKHWQVDVALLEVGLGGRLDAVNIVDPDLSIVTSVGLDHQDWLGDTLDQIGYEKAGIARAGKPFICGQPEVSLGFKQEAKRIGAKSLYFAEDYSISPDLAVNEGWLLKYGQDKALRLPKGHIPYYNMASAIVGLDQLGLLPNQAGIESACDQTRVAGRLTQYLGRCNSGPNSGKTFKFILDVAHNEQAAGFLATQLSHCSLGVLAMLVDKDPASVVQSLPAVKNWYLAGLSGYRGQSSEALEQKLVAKAVLSDCDHSCHLDVEAALQSVIEKPSSESEQIEVLVIGSFLTVSAAETALHKIKGLQIYGNES
jgi:dihydrofolate synthase/folylpolyglutamate synthase